MPGQLSANKEKITYAEFSDTREALALIREEQSEKEGREITEAEQLRTIVLNYVNKTYKAKGLPILDLDPESSPGGVAATTHAHGTGGVRRK